MESSVDHWTLYKQPDCHLSNRRIERQPGSLPAMMAYALAQSSSSGPCDQC